MAKPASGTSAAKAPPALRWSRPRTKITTDYGPVREKFERIAKRRGRKIAKVAVAREILTRAYYGLPDEAPCPDNDTCHALPPKT